MIHLEAILNSKTLLETQVWNIVISVVFDAFQVG